MWTLVHVGTLPHPHARACSRHDPPNSSTHLHHSASQHQTVRRQVRARLQSGVGAAGSGPTEGVGEGAACRGESGQTPSTPASQQQPENGLGTTGSHEVAGSTDRGDGISEYREGAGPKSGSSGASGGGGGGSGGSGGGGTGPGPDGGGDNGDASRPQANRYPIWLRAWLITCGAVYLLLLRPRMFAERDERKRHMEREAAEYAKYEEDWDRLVARYQAKGEGPGAKGGAPAKPAAQQQLR